MTASPLTLTPSEARLIYDALRNAWAPSREYATYMAAMKKLEAMSFPGATEEAPAHRRNHRGS